METIETPDKKNTYWRLVVRQYRKNIFAVIAVIVLAILGAVALGAPFLAGDRPIFMVKDGERFWFPNIIAYKDLVGLQGRYHEWKPNDNEYALRPLVAYAPERSNLMSRLEPPSRKHLLGTDDRGRDVLSRMIWGTRISMSVGFVAVGISSVIGVVIGALAGFYGGKTDMVMLRIIEIMKCFPVFIFIISLIAFLPQSILNIMIVLGIVSWTGVARLVRGEFLRLRSQEFALAAHASGLSDARVIFRHLLPNALAPVLVSAAFGVAGAILFETALSFLGFGVPPPTASWGETLSQSKQYLNTAWWLIVFPGTAIFLTVTAFNLVGQGLRDAMDPRLRE